MRHRVALACAALAACAPEPTIPAGRVEIKDLPVPLPRRSDVLVVVDNSPAMRDHVANLAAGAPDWIAVMETLPGGLPDLHLAVVTTDLGSDGAPAIAGCSGTGDDGRFRGGGFIADELDRDGTRHPNYVGTLRDVFAERFAVGADGCAFPRPFAAMRRALEHPANAGFLRDNAFLAIIFVTAVDDCSFASSDFLAGGTRDAPCFTRLAELAPVDDYVAFLTSLKRDPRLVLVSSISGGMAPLELQVDPGGTQVTPWCEYGGATATPANRIAALREPFANAFTTICQSGVTDAVRISLQPLTTVIGDPCFAGTLLDVDPIEPGLQPDCRVWLASRTATLDVPACAVTSDPLCWSLVIEPTTCVAGDHWKLDVDAASVPSGWDHLIAQCATAEEE